MQMWVLPDARNFTPGYEQLDIGDELARGGLVTVASGMAKHADDRAISIRQQDAALSAARMDADSSLTLPDAPFVHLYVARGEVTLEGAGGLSAGDAVRIAGGGGQRVSATEASEILVWEMTQSASG